MPPIRRFLPSALLILLSTASAFPQEKAAEPVQIISPIPADQVIPESDNALRSLRAIDSDLQTENVVPITRGKLADFTKKTDPFYEQSAQILEANPSLDRLRLLNEAWTAMSGSLLEWKKLLSKRSKDLEDRLTEVNRTLEVWKKTKPTLPSGSPELTQRLQSVLALCESIRPKILERQKELLSLESKLAEQDSRLQDMLGSIQQGNTQAMTNLFVQDSPAVWSPEFRGSMDQSLHASSDSWANQSAALKTYLVWQKGKIFFQILLAVLLIVAMFLARRKMREWAGADPELKFAFEIFETPIATAFLLALGISGWLYPYAPNLWKGFLGAFILIPTIIILHRLVERRLFSVLNALVFFYFLDQVRLLASAQPGSLRMVFLFETISGIVFLAWLLLSFQRRTDSIDYLSRAVQIGGRFALVLTSFALLADLGGYDRLGTLLLNGVLRSSYLAVIFYALVHVIQALIMAALKSPFMARLGVVKQYRTLIQRRAFRIFSWIVFLGWLTLALELFSIREPIFKTLAGILTATITIGTLNFSLSHLIAFGVTIWASFLISRLVRFILDHDVYPHFHLAQGVPYAISNVLHYSILLLAFFMATAALGIDMTKFTILVSAFGVGIGFGLQNIINNFVSGLILLFERPVKIGDSVQVGDAIGTVRRIGIRASILKTNNGSEIIVPNATLISSQVTNWTLSKQRRMIVIPVNVVRGPNPEHVMELMRKEAVEHSLVLKEPIPQVVVIALAANLSLELRVWTANVDSWVQIRSDLLTAISAALDKEEIKTA